MKSLIGRSIYTYQEEGAVTLFRWSLRELYLGVYYKWRSRQGHYSLTLNGQTIVFTAPTSAIVKRNRRRFKSEKQELSKFISEIEKDDIVYDIGANTGIYSLFAANKCTNGKVIAFEPYPPNLGLLKQDISRNQLENIDVVDIALSDSVGNIEFSYPEEDDAGYGSSSIEVEESEATINVPTTTGDQLIADGEIPEPNVVKIDVEGAESLVVEGLRDALSAPSCRLVYCEVHLPGIDYRPSIEDFGSSLADLRSRLEDMGFHVRKIHSRGESEVFLRAHK